MTGGRGSSGRLPRAVYGLEDGFDRALFNEGPYWMAACEAEEFSSGVMSRFCDIVSNRIWSTARIQARRRARSRGILLSSPVFSGTFRGVLSNDRPPRGILLKTLNHSPVPARRRAGPRARKHAGQIKKFCLFKALLRLFEQGGLGRLSISS